jgi:hypothetical protein
MTRLEEMTQHIHETVRAQRHVCNAKDVIRYLHGWDSEELADMLCKARTALVAAFDAMSEVREKLADLGRRETAR